MAIAVGQDGPTEATGMYACRQVQHSATRLNNAHIRRHAQPGFMAHMPARMHCKARLAFAWQL